MGVMDKFLSYMKLNGDEEYDDYDDDDYYDDDYYDDYLQIFRLFSIFFLAFNTHSSLISIAIQFLLKLFDKYISNNAWSHPTSYTFFVSTKFAIVFNLLDNISHPYSLLVF